MPPTAGLTPCSSRQAHGRSHERAGKTHGSVAGGPPVAPADRPSHERVGKTPRDQQIPQPCGRVDPLWLPAEEPTDAPRSRQTHGSAAPTAGWIPLWLPQTGAPTNEWARPTGQQLPQQRGPCGAARGHFQERARKMHDARARAPSDPRPGGPPVAPADQPTGAPTRGRTPRGSGPRRWTPRGAGPRSGPRRPP